MSDISSVPLSNMIVTKNFQNFIDVEINLIELIMVDYN